MQSATLWARLSTLCFSDFFTSLLLHELLKCLDVSVQFGFSSLVDRQPKFQSLGEIQLDFSEFASAEASSSASLATLSLNYCFYAHDSQPRFSDCES